MEDLRRYLAEFVDPTIADFEANPTSVRHAFLACVAVFHGVDYLAHPRPSRTTREHFRKESSAFDLVDSVAHAFKHVTAGSKFRPTVGVEEVISRLPAKFDEAKWDHSRFDDEIGGVTIDRAVRIDLLTEIKKAREFLGTKIL
jgi:hypothetical protein